MANLLPPELFDALLLGLTFTDIINYSHAFAAARDSVQRLMHLRLCQLLLPYFPENAHKKFWDALDSACGGIVGSGTLWITTPQPDWTPRDLNLLLMLDHGADLFLLLADTNWVEVHAEASIPNVASCLRPSTTIPTARNLDRLRMFTKNGRTITVTEFNHSTPFPHLLTADHSLRTMILTRTALIALNPVDVIKRQVRWKHAVPWSIAKGKDADAWCRSVGVARLFPLTCTKACNALLRRLRGGRGIGVLFFDAHERHGPVAAYADSGFMSEDLSWGWTWAMCRNMHCSYYGFPRRLTAPSKPPLATADPKDAALIMKDYFIRNATPSFPAVYTAILFPTASMVPRIVPVPLDYGLTRYCTVDDLRTHIWVYPKAAMSPTVLLGGSVSFTERRWSIPLDESRLLVVIMQSVNEDANRNHVFQNIQVHGDVLMICENDNQPRDLSVDDIPLTLETFTKYVLHL
ncbi:hypothetical protein C8J57DRAFT_1506079 [Mycena rebaudengoi]|nr:hypothetical protein C8J57DRAFT_1506079 [Mycena rebaudengoi]